MAVSKRLRYEILRRDNHTCRYCGASAPDAPLRVDHVVPQALGGSDTPDNLVTSCEPCNSGKSSATVDSAVVANVADDALRWAEAMKQAAVSLLEQEKPKLEYRNTFLSEWNRWGVGEGGDRKGVALPGDWKSSVERFRVAGLPAWAWSEIVDTAMGISKVRPESKFKYCAGIAWKKIQAIQDEARRIAAVAPPRRPARDATVDAITATWVGSFEEQFGSSPTEAMLLSVRDLAAAGFDVGADAEQLLNAAVAGGACGEPIFGLFFREDPEYLAAIEEAYFVWRTCWMKTTEKGPDNFDVGCFRVSVGEALGLEYTQYQIVQQAARTGRARGIDLVEDLKAAGSPPAGGEF